MPTRIALALLAALTITVPVATATAGSSQDSQSVAVAKKKATWCDKRVKQRAKRDTKSFKRRVTYKRVGFVKAAKFSLYTRRIAKRTADEYFFCSEAPKFNGGIAAWSGIKKTSSVKAVKNNCAVFYSETKDGTYQSDGQTRINIIPYHFFRKSSKYPPQTNAATLGMKGEKVALASLQLTKNCVLAATYTVNGAAKLLVAGVGDFPYQGFHNRDLTGATLADMKSLSISVTGPGSVLVKWTNAGAPQQLEYPGTMR